MDSKSLSDMSIIKGSLGVTVLDVFELLTSALGSSSVEHASKTGMPKAAKTIGLHAVFKKLRRLFIIFFV
jgi:hypothetical protein